jgi:uncharacterized protein (TIGR00251 family)
MKVVDVSRDKGDRLELDVLVSPRSNRSGLDGFDEWRKRVILRVRSPPLDGRANKEVESYFREVTGCKSKVTAGMTSHQKIVTISGDPKSIIEALERSLRWTMSSALNAWRRSWIGSGPLRRTT